MVIPSSVKSDLDWWRDRVESSSAKIKIGKFDTVIFTDASKSGWGATSYGRNVHGFWNNLQKSWHINYLELFTVNLALQSFAEKLSNCQILLRIDNTTAIAYINRMGGTKYPKYNRLARQIWKWAEDRKIFLFASYIPSSENYLADALSRINNEDTEWEMSRKAFDRITEALGIPEVDMFASNLNKKCQRFFSWLPELGAEAVDAFTVDWQYINVYAFPPFAVISRVLRKIQQDKASGILVVPDWPNQPWYPVWRSLVVGETVILHPNTNLLLSPCRAKHHPQAKHLRLVAARISAKHSG